NKLHEYPQIKDATSDQQFRGLQETVVIDRDAAARLGIQPQAVDSTLYDAFGQRQVSIIYTQQNQYHVVLEVDPALQRDPHSLEKTRSVQEFTEKVLSERLGSIEKANARWGAHTTWAAEQRPTGFKSWSEVVTFL